MSVEELVGAAGPSGVPSSLRPSCAAIPLHLVEPLEDVIVEENSTAILEFKIGNKNSSFIAVWYKDGRVPIETDILTINTATDICQLKISPVSMRDCGLYHAVGTQGTKRIQTKAALYVARARFDDCGVLYMKSQTFDVMAVHRHVFDLYIKKRETIAMEIVLQTKNATEFKWYKSNVPVEAEKEKVIIACDSKSSQLVITHADYSDTGIYHVVAKTSLGIVSSFAHVVVYREMFPNIHVPSIVEHLPEEIECMEYDDVRLICKVRINTMSDIVWSRNSVEIKDDQKFKKEDYGNGYVGLRILAIETHDAAVYTLTVRDAMLYLDDTTSCLVHVNECHDVPLPTAALLKPLKTVVASFGSHVILKCSFDLRNFKYFYVVWHIGRYRVERTNHLFYVVNYEGDFYLMIKCVSGEMAGLINCQLRRSFPDRKSVQVGTTSANLAVVPQAFIDEEKKLASKYKRRFINLTPLHEIKNLPAKAESLSSKLKQIRIKAEDPRKVMNYLLHKRPLSDPLEIIYCRTDDERLSFVEVTKPSNDINGNSIVVYNANEGAPTHQEIYNQRIIIKWDAPKAATWYSIELLQASGIYCNGELTSKPEFEVRNPPTERILKFKITTVPEGAGEATVSIMLPMEAAPRSKDICQIKHTDEFPRRYAKTGERIGSGAFGTVALVKSTMGEYFAAKTLKTKTQKRRTTAMREYEVMSILKHPKLIELIDVFMSRDSVVFVMDYLWGGELFDRIAEEEHIKELDVVYYIRQILEGLRYLHTLKIAHLDLKPENIICQNPNSRLIKLIDFGLARVLDDNQVTRAIYGTRDYVAPEVLNYERITVACDMWSLGVVTYMLLSGVMPFAGETWAERCVNITRARYNFGDSAFKDISELAKDFITNLLVLSPDQRMDARVALTHPWITRGPPKGARPHMTRTRQNLKSYLATYRARWQPPQGILQKAGYWLCLPLSGRR